MCACHAQTSALKAVRLERLGLIAMEEALKDQTPQALGGQFQAACEALAQCTGRIIVTGMGKSGLIGRKLAATFASTGTPAYFVHPGEASHGDLGMIQQGDVVLALSWSGETGELADLITYSRRFNVTLVAISSNADSILAKSADVCMILPKAEEACPHGLAPTTSTTLQLVLGDALAIALLENRGFTPQDFRQYHPRGKLGARLTLVRDIMHQDDRLPLVSEAAKMADAVMQMTQQGFGCAGIVDAQAQLIGIVTDGDMRRHMCADLMMVPVKHIMTCAPLTIKGDVLAVEALNLLQKKRISTLFVVDAAHRPIGIVHFHDLLKIGAA